MFVLLLNSHLAVFVCLLFSTVSGFYAACFVFFLLFGWPFLYCRLPFCSSRAVVCPFGFPRDFPGSYVLTHVFADFFL